MKPVLKNKRKKERKKEIMKPVLKNKRKKERKKERKKWINYKVGMIPTFAFSSS